MRIEGTPPANSGRRKAPIGGRRALVLLAGLALMALVEGCGGTSANSSSSSTANSSSGPLIVNFAVPTATLDPDFASNEDVGIDGSLYSTLTQVTYEPGPLPGTYQQKLGVSFVKPYLATSWTISDGGRTYTFHLRPGLKFPSGDPVDAQAVVWSFQRTLKSASNGSSFLEDNQYKPPLIKPQDMTAPNSTTVVLHLSRPSPDYLLALSDPSAAAVYDPALVEKNGGQKAGQPQKWLASHSAGYGPYLIQSYQPGHQLVLVANPNFFDPPASKKIIVNYITDDASLLLQAKSGAADVTVGLSGVGVHSLVGNSCCEIGQFTSRYAEELNFPETDRFPFFKNTDFRLALAYAFPYSAVLQKIAFGYGKSYFGPWMPSFSWYDPTVGAPLQTDMAKAKQLLAASGIKTPVSFPIYVNQGDTASQEAATAAAGVWQQLGVNAHVDIIASSNFVNILI